MTGGRSLQRRRDGVGIRDRRAGARVAATARVTDMVNDEHDHEAKQSGSLALTVTMLPSQ